MKKRLAILGSTGSIGINTLEVVRQHPDQFEVVALAAGGNVDELVKQVEEFKPKLISMSSKDAAEEVKLRVSDPVRTTYGEEGPIEVATHPDATYLVSALVGSRGFDSEPWRRSETGKTIGLANKETLVMGGAIVMEEAKKAGVDILPIDSEHSAIYQCLHRENPSQVRRIILTASGGPFRDWPREKIEDATREEALDHPQLVHGRQDHRGLRQYDEQGLGSD